MTVDVGQGPMSRPGLTLRNFCPHHPRSCRRFGVRWHSPRGRRAAKSKRGSPNMATCLVGMEACVGAHLLMEWSGRAPHRRFERVNLEQRVGPCLAKPLQPLPHSASTSVRTSSTSSVSTSAVLSCCATTISSRDLPCCLSFATLSLMATSIARQHADVAAR
jgi:hypothetical protein